MWLEIKYYYYIVSTQKYLTQVLRTNITQLKNKWLTCCILMTSIRYDIKNWWFCMKPVVKTIDLRRVPPIRRTLRWQQIQNALSASILNNKSLSKWVQKGEAKSSRLNSNTHALNTKAKRWVSNVANRPLAAILNQAQINEQARTGVLWLIEAGWVWDTKRFAELWLW